MLALDISGSCGMEQTFCFFAAVDLEVAWGKAAGFFPLGAIFFEAVIENRNH